MKKLKKPSPCLLVLFLLSAASPLHAADLSDLTYVVNPGSVTITDCDTAATGVLVIPAIIEGEPVTSIGDQAFQSCAGLTGITLPASLTSIGYRAFRFCNSLAGIIIPASVTSIGFEAFTSCSSLLDIGVSPGNLDYSSDAGVLFSQDRSTLIQYPGGKSGPYVIADGVIFIGNGAFRNCTSLSSIIIPPSVASVGDNAFLGCTGLLDIEASSGSRDFASEDGVLFNLDKSSLIQCPGGKSGTYAPPASVTSIGDGAFQVCPYLSSIIIPASVTSIGNYAFRGCGLSSIELPGNLTSIGYSAFSFCPGLSSINIPASLTSMGTRIFYSCTSLAVINIPASVTSIGNYAFYGCTSLADIVFAGNAPGLGTDAFASVNAAARVYILPGATGFGTTFGGLPVIDAIVFIAALEAAATSNATEIALLEQRPTLEEVQDARLGSVILIKDGLSGEVNFDFILEETEDLANWTPVVNGTWTDPGDGGIELDLPLAPSKRFFRIVVEFQQ